MQMSGIFWVFFTVLLNSLRSKAQFQPQCALEGDRCLGSFQCCSANCYSGRCAAPNCLDDGQFCLSFMNIGQCCSGICSYMMTCKHRPASSNYKPMLDYEEYDYHGERNRY